METYSSLSRLALSFGFVAVLVFIISYFSVSSAVSAKPDKFPDKLTHELHLPNNGKVWEMVRHHFQNGNRIRKDSFAIWDQSNDSVVEYASFREDESVWCSEKRYSETFINFLASAADHNYPEYRCGENAPVVDSKDLGILRRIAKFDTDNVSFLSHEVRRKDGSLERKGFKERDGRYHIQYFFPDGITVQRDRYFVRRLPVWRGNWKNLSESQRFALQNYQYKLSFERVYQVGGILTESEIVLVDGNYHKNIFNKDGVRVATIAQGDGITQSGDVYSGDGKVLLASYSRSPWMSEEQYFRPDGSLKEARLFYMGSNESRFFDENGQKVLYKQVWRNRPASGDSQARSILSRVHVYDYASKQEILIRMTNDGSKMSEVTFGISSLTSVVKTLNDEGLVVKTEVKTSGQTNSVEEPAIPDEKLVFDQHLFAKSEQVQFETFKFQDPDSPAWIYDYEDNVAPRLGEQNLGVVQY
jgi:hypothetical protein